MRVPVCRHAALHGARPAFVSLILSSADSIRGATRSSPLVPCQSTPDLQERGGAFTAWRGRGAFCRKPRSSSMASAPWTSSKHRRLTKRSCPCSRRWQGECSLPTRPEVERAFLGGALRRQGLRLRGPVLDTNALGRLLMAERGGSPPRFLPLGQLAGDLRLPVHRQHNALSDALTTAQVFLAVVSHLEERGPETVGSLAMAQRRT